MAAHPVTVVVTDDLRRRRLVVLLRLPLVLPHVVWSLLWVVALLPVAVAGWLVAIVLGRLPGWMHEFIARFVRHSLHYRAWFLLAAEPYPPFLGGSPYPVDARIAPPGRQNRLGVAVRWLLAIPAWFLAGMFEYVVYPLAMVAWFIALAAGRVPEGIRDTLAFGLKYETQTFAYSLLLAGRYPSFASIADEARAAEREAPPRRAVSCPACGQSVDVEEGEQIVTCPACSSRVVVPATV